MEFLLIPIGLITSTLSGVLGMGGGILLFAIMAEFYQPSVLVPLHGIVQWFSNSSRAIVNFKSINWRIVLAYSLGAGLGAAVGSHILVELPQDAMRLVIAIFILYVTWAPKPKSIRPIKGKFFILGTAATLLSLFVGAIGPLVAPFYLSAKLNRYQLIATKATSQAVTHSLKVIVYFGLGFSIGSHWQILIGLIAAVTLGSYIGKRILKHLSETLFRRLFLVCITVLGVRMLIISLINLWPSF